MGEKKQNSTNDIYFKDYLKNKHSYKIDLTNLLIFILSNVTMVVFSIIIFSLISNGTINIKPKAYDKNEINSPIYIAAGEAVTSTTTSCVVANITTHAVHTTDVYVDTSTEAVLSTDITVTYGVVNTEKDPLNLRSRPSTDSEILIKIPKNSTVEIISEEADWLKIKYDNIEGYVSKQYILLSDSIEEAIVVDENNASNKRIGIVITENDPLNVRKSPSINSQKIGTVSKGGEVIIISEQGDWFEIEYGSGIGYVSKKYVSVQG